MPEWLLVDRYSARVLARITGVDWEVAVRYGMDRYGARARVQDRAHSTAEQRLAASLLPFAAIPAALCVRPRIGPGRRPGNWLPGWHQTIRDLKASGELPRLPTCAVTTSTGGVS
jgi:hypothetical protein